MATEHTLMSKLLMIVSMEHFSMGENCGFGRVESSGPLRGRLSPSGDLGAQMWGLLRPKLL